MSEFETFECRHCESAFKAYPEANAATEEFCSPSCATAAAD